MKKQKLNLKRETLVTLDVAQLSAVNGGDDISRSICISNNGSGRSCTICWGARGAIKGGGSGW